MIPHQMRNPSWPADAAKATNCSCKKGCQRNCSCERFESRIFRIVVVDLWMKCHQKVDLYSFILQYHHTYCFVIIDLYAIEVTRLNKVFTLLVGHYGTGIVSYFFFLRWLLLLNFIMFALIFFFIILPPVALKKVALLPEVSEVNSNSTTNATSLQSTPEWYKTYEDASANYVLHGWMEMTLMFLGTFSPNNLMMGYSNGTEHWYRLPLAILIVTVVYLIICMVMMVRSMVNSAAENLVIHEGQFHRYFNLAFCSWDFCITEPNSADLKQMSIYVDIQSNLKEDAFLQKQDQRSNAMKVCLYTARIVLNLISFAILVGAGYLIYYVVIQSAELQKYQAQNFSEPVIMLLQFLTPITITVLNLVLPILFKVMAHQERYRADTQINLTLLRSVFVRLASLAVLMATFARQISCDPNTDKDCVHIPCWETYVGQEMYKLILVDFFVVMLLTMVVETLRRVLVVKLSSFKLSKLIGKPEFDIAKNVLDLIYGQTVCCQPPLSVLNMNEITIAVDINPILFTEHFDLVLGVFYCPMLPAIGVIKNLMFFYSKKYTLLHNCKPAMHAYKSSKSNTFYILVLLLAFFLSCVPLAYSFSVFSPSKGCGPFRLDGNMWEEATEAVQTSAKSLQQFVGIIFSAGFAIPLFILLCFLIYYYMMQRSAYRELMLVLKDRLKEEGKDKQYLLARLTQLSQTSVS
ncbi:Transmembrane channel-like protein 7 [Nymphon striatum]|nr:Transmembrane channel-like protein 7 [Nymphon striatum]